MPKLTPEEIEKFNPIHGEFTKMPIEDFASVLKHCVTDYVEQLGGENPFTSGEHTFDEWMAAFGRYMSF